MRTATKTIVAAFIMASVVGCGDDKTKTPADGNKTKTPADGDKTKTSADGEKTPDIVELTAGAAAGQQWDSNSLNMKFCWCPPGEFTMGGDRRVKRTHFGAEMRPTWVGLTTRVTWR